MTLLFLCEQLVTGNEVRRLYFNKKCFCLKRLCRRIDSVCLSQSLYIIRQILAVLESTHRFRRHWKRLVGFFMGKFSCSK